LDRGKNLADLCVQLGKLHLQDAFLGMQHHIERASQLRQVALHSGAHPAANAITVHRSAQHLANGKTNARAVWAAVFAIKSDHVPRKVLSALPVNGLEVGVFEQA
jgi:hypothetical protein